MADSIRAPGNDVDAVQQDSSFVRTDLSVQHIEAGRLASAIGTDHRNKLAHADVKRYVGDNPVAAECLGQVARRKQRHSCLSRQPPARPWGKTSTKVIIVRPSTSRHSDVVCSSTSYRPV